MMLRLRGLADRMLGSAAIGSLFVVALTSSLAGATEMPAAGTSTVAQNPSPNPAYDVLIKSKVGINTTMIRDVFVMGGEDLNHWPYIEHSDPDGNGNIQGVNFVIPDKSRFGWRFITRVSETPYNVALRATIDADGNGIFEGSVFGNHFYAGKAGYYTPAALVWGNHLGGDFLTTLFSSDTRMAQGVAATVFGISYGGAAPILAQDAYGNLGIAGDTTTRALTATSFVAASTVKVNGAAITSGSGAPNGGCSPGDLYLRKSHGSGPTVYTCAATSAWAPLGAGAAPRSQVDLPQSLPPPLLAQSAFDKRSLSAAPASTNLGSVQATLGSVPSRWYVCALVEASTLEVGQSPSGGFITVGIGTATAGSGAAFRMYSRPDSETNNEALGNGIVSDWPAQPTGTVNGRYCSSYPGGASVSFTAYALPSPGLRGGAIYTSGQVEIQAFPQ